MAEHQWSKVGEEAAGPSLLRAAGDRALSQHAGLDNDVQLMVFKCSENAVIFTASRLCRIAGVH
jgi:hypothetical protein